MEGGRPFDIKPAGMLALDVARIEAGLLLIEVDFASSKKAMIAPQAYTPYEMGLGRLVNLDKGAVRRPAGASRRAARAATPVRSSVSRSSGPTSSASTRSWVSPPAVSATASRVAVPVYRSGRQIGKATSTTWSPVLKKMIALATIDRPHFGEGEALQMEVTVEAVRHQVRAKVVGVPFFNPARKTATPPA